MDALIRGGTIVDAELGARGDLLIYRKGVKDDLSAKEKAVLREIKSRW